MKCLHICNDLMGSKVFENLYQRLHLLNVEQTIFYALKKNMLDKAKNYSCTNSTIIISKPLRKYHRLLFRLKINYLYKSLKSNLKFTDFDIVHATTLFSDGALALRFKKDFKTPYIVAVRTADVDAFLKYRPDLIFLANEILTEASQIIFVNYALKERFLNHHLIRKNRTKLEQKCHIVYNGIDSYWLNNQSTKRNTTPNKILYVGTLIKRKNAVKLINSVLSLNKSGVQCELTVVGSGGALQKKVEQLASSNQPAIKYLGAINDKEALKKAYNSHQIFALPSKSETFGLVYLEALSQGLPVLYMENEGIDGIFNFKIGEKCKANEISIITSNLEKLINNYSNYEINKIDFSEFSWEVIAKTYIELYNTAIKENK